MNDSTPLDGRLLLALVLAIGPLTTVLLVADGRTSLYAGMAVGVGAVVTAGMLGYRATDS